MADGPDAARLVTALREARTTVATAESLTGGLLGATLTAVPGASAVYRGGVVAYATDLKATLLDVDRTLLSRVGAVHPEVAAAMARGAARRLGADVGLATTGVAGPEPQDGRPVGTVFVALWRVGDARAVELHLSGDRAAVRQESVRAALALLASVPADLHADPPAEQVP